MRTALVLLFILALAAIPGALLPQRSLNESNVNEYIATNGRIAEIYDQLMLFDVFESPWFAAIYVLLMISLVGCIIPRSIDHWRAFRTPPTRAPKYLHRLPLNTSGVVDKPFDEVQAASRRNLRKWRVNEYDAADDRAGAFSLSAERGFSRELANLIFHIAIVALLITMAAGRMVYYEGQRIVVTNSQAPMAVPVEQSTEFCNTSTSNFDSFRAGPLFDGTGLTPFCFITHNFHADYLPNGQAEMFTSDISYAVGEDILSDPETWEDYQLQVNHPLRVAGDRVYLQGHGFAPQFTVTFPNGEERTQMMQWEPTDPTFFLSSGAIRFDPPAGMYPDLYERRQNQIALQGLFAPTAQWDGENNELLTSAFPEMRDPAVAIDIYRGDAGLDTGRAQSIWELDSSLVHTGQLQRVERVNLEQGESVTLDDGTEITFDGAAEFANFQISRDPFQIWVLVSAVIMLGSLVGSLMIRRRRIWIRLRPADDGKSTHVEMGGLARTDRAGWGAEFDEIARDILELEDPDEVEEDSLVDEDIIHHQSKG
ncbi:cytochrome C biogenesis protein ResB [Corynebacterium yudongzhengii]|uniref:Cytochrome c biogenesis protein ResB n=1 Tax=Corynebacterium yudongzhengii TaxID=2080740 RepID=A0A2U1TA90_9CORY|nr:cytochrome C biogenesis protein ResB [Corynebacterium yudongzhengii]PWC02835.1 cytochrome c biogenesis protein ResB [Corynebacterium yudongzhengii]